MTNPPTEHFYSPEAEIHQQEENLPKSTLNDVVLSAEETIQ
eukprot:CAMPEP_0202960762 /NCGR_PEP_ID=MMETSP1396-20130829/4914_1 /ASSEMBLY_ACC=CAM_ASM_000872 /TAXON_ID= /ORGANISM="Pseudokeronopsis sp., Strain Brazil" /LENGTH=40 /DNA_ID= /DNA_START= /DNA_END= /DNA_ORIENTATION=